jgi:hypothetical protein
MLMDLMKMEPWATVVSHLVKDQGDMPMPVEFHYDPAYHDRDMVTAERYLLSLEPQKLEDFTIGEQDLEIASMLRVGGEDAKKANEIIEDLYLLVIGEEDI